MVVSFGQKAIDCRHLTLATGQIRENDLLVVNGARFEVKSIARNCPHIENLSKVFTAALVRDEKGNYRHEVISGRLEVYRPRSAK